MMTPIQRRPGAAVVSRCADAAVIAASLWLAYSLRGLDDPDRYVLAGVLGLFIYVLVGGGTATPRHSGAATLSQEFAATLGAWTTTLAGLMVIAWMTKTTADFSRIAVSLWAIFSALGLLSWRAARLLALRSAASARSPAAAAVAGTGPRARRFAEFLQATQATQLQLAGFFAEPSAPDARTRSLPLPLLGDFDALVERAQAREVQIVFFVLPPDSDDVARRLLAALSDTPATVYVVPSLFTEELAHARWVDLGGMPLVSIFESPFIGVNGWIKRGEDLALALVILAVAAVPMLLIAAAVKLSSPGPVLFRQRRHGIDGREIRIFKFRTMVVEEDGAAVRHAVRGDSRLSPIGDFLRRTSLDELPQFLNVLRGEMSVVGPRPHAVAINERYRQLIPGYMLRHRVKPGITGWAQIHGLRGKDSVDHMSERIRYDLWYLGRWSLWLDLWIVLRTVALLAGDRHAV